MNTEYFTRRTFAIISHPDAGKTSLTEQLLCVGGILKEAGTVKGRGTKRYVASDWMEVEKRRGISVTSSVMQIPYRAHVLNLLDTPGHSDFSEDTYRTLTAADMLIMVIDASKGVEARTIKLMEVARLRNTPVITFINKIDRETLEPMALLDEVETVLKMACTAVTWPMGTGQRLKGLFHVQQRAVVEEVGPRALPPRDVWHAEDVGRLQEEVDYLRGASHPFCLPDFLAGQLTPVFFGSALSGLGIAPLLDKVIEWAPPPLSRAASARTVYADEPKLSGFIFKIQANMDPNHRDRMAFMRLVSGKYVKGMRLWHVRLKRFVLVSDACAVLAGQRSPIDLAYAGDIIGLPNHGALHIGDTLTEGESFQFLGIPHFAPELFRRIVLKEPMKQKALLKGLSQLAEEGAVQLFRPVEESSRLILGAIGELQFDVVVSRLQYEYKVEATYEPVTITTARWIAWKDQKAYEKFEHRCQSHLAHDSSGQLTYLAPSRTHLLLTQSRHPEITFLETREH